MNDQATVLRTHIVSKCASVTALTGTTRIYRETAEPPEPGWKPSDGAALCFQARPGEFVAQEDALIDASVQFTCYAADRNRANALYRALVDDLQQAGGATVRYVRFTALGQTFTHPETGWPFVRCVARVFVSKG
jgi:hypothetical protein